MPNVQPCKACGKRIMLVKTGAGRMLPLNADPDPKGRWVIHDGVAVYAYGDMPPDSERYSTHWGDCPEANAFRRK